MNLGSLGKLQWRLWASWGRQDRGGRRGRGENDLLQFSSIVATSILQLPSFFAQAGERAEEQSGQGVVRLLESFQKIILSRTHQPVPSVQLFFLYINFQGSLGGDLRRGQPLAQAEVSQQCGEARDADPLGISH